MCYAGGPYCDNRYGQDLIKAEENFRNAQNAIALSTLKHKVKSKLAEKSIDEMTNLDYSELRISQEKLKQLRKELNEMTPAQVRAFNKEPEILEIKYEAAREKYREAQDAYLYSPRGIEEQEAADLKRKINEPDREESVDDTRMMHSARAFRLRQYHNKGLREYLKKHGHSLEYPYRESISKTQATEYLTDEDGYSVYYGDLQQPYSREQLNKIVTTEDSTNTRVIYEGKNGMVSGYLLTDGYNNPRLIPSTSQYTGEEMIALSQDNCEKYNIRPSNLPGSTTYTPENRRGEWSKYAEKYKNAPLSPTEEGRRAYFAQNWNKVGSPDDSPYAQELKGKVFSAMETVVRTGKKREAAMEEYVQVAKKRNPTTGLPTQPSKSDPELYKAYRKYEKARIQHYAALKHWDAVDSLWKSSDASLQGRPIQEVLQGAHQRER